MLTRLRAAYIHWRFRRVIRQGAKVLREMGITGEEAAENVRALTEALRKAEAAKSIDNSSSQC